jgi:hypothetical protein
VHSRARVRVYGLCIPQIQLHHYRCATQLEVFVTPRFVCCVWPLHTTGFESPASTHIISVGCDSPIGQFLSTSLPCHLHFSRSPVQPYSPVTSHSDQSNCSVGLQEILSSDDDDSSGEVSDSHIESCTMLHSPSGVHNAHQQKLPPDEKIKLAFVTKEMQRGTAYECIKNLDALT